MHEVINNCGVLLLRDVFHDPFVGALLVPHRSSVCLMACEREQKLLLFALPSNSLLG